MAHLAGAHVRKVVGRQNLQGEFRRTRDQRHPPIVRPQRQFDLRAVRQLADDIVKHVGRNGGAALPRHLGLDGLDNLNIEVGRCQRYGLALGVKKDIRQDRNCIAPFDHACHVVKSLQKRISFDNQPH